jgi:2-methylcitrate dehydratase PrpD
MPSSPMTSTEHLARHAALTRFEDLPATTVHAVKRALLDYLACAVAGADLPVTRGVRAYVASLGGAPQASVIAGSMKLDAPSAAFVNGTAAHGLDFDDGHTRSSAHPGGVIFSAVLAKAEALGAHPQRMIVAAAVGYEVMLRIASAIHPASAMAGWHNTPVAGVFGATAATGSLLALNVAQMRNALGLASSFAGGIRQYLIDGSEVKRLHPGKAARDGLFCAELARQGITGSDDALEGKNGLFRAVVGDRGKPQLSTRDFGCPFEIDSVYFKPYPCCRHFHAALDGVLALKKEVDIPLSGIDSIEIGLYRVGAYGHDHVRAETLLDAQMSAPCAVVLALTHERVSAQGFEPQTFASSLMQELLSKTRVFVDEECEALYPRQRSGMVRIRLRDGRVLEKRVIDPRGEGANPLSDEDLIAKFVANGEAKLGAARTQAIISQVMSFDRQAGSVELFKLLR